MVNSLLGWVVWKALSLLIRRELRRNRRKLVAAGVVTLVIAGGVVAARSGTGDRAA